MKALLILVMAISVFGCSCACKDKNRPQIEYKTAAINEVNRLGMTFVGSTEATGWRRSRRVRGFLVEHKDKLYRLVVSPDGLGNNKRYKWKFYMEGFGD